MVNILNFPGWQIYVNGVEIKPETDPFWPVMKIIIPPTPDDVYVSGFFGNTPIRSAANIISLLAISMCAIMIISNKKLIIERQNAIH